MSINIDSLQTFTDADLLKLYRWAMANGAAGQSRSVNGRNVQFPPLERLMKAIEWLESRVAQEASEPGGNIALVQVGRPQ